MSLCDALVEIPFRLNSAATFLTASSPSAKPVTYVNECKLSVTGFTLQPCSGVRRRFSGEALSLSGQRIEKDK